ncbi:hypothetical protein HK101_002930 [Irineochytrium annulatum]|nr:hypothetical protein HK101_002930 [Irineochytrium annulatum]
MASSSLTFVPTNTALATITVVSTLFPTPEYSDPPPSFPNATLCKEKGWYLGPDAVDATAPPGPYPVKGQQVYIQDAQNFCINLPDPNSTYLKKVFYDQGFAPSIVQGEGFVQCYCVGDYLSPGCKKMPAGAITSAHVLTNQVKNGEQYVQLFGTMDCGVLNINCVGGYFEKYDDGGQYDSVPFINCGKEPYSGVDSSKHPTMDKYVQIAGDNQICMRICSGGTGYADPCNVKNDTDGCQNVMGYVEEPGFSTDGVPVQVNLPPPSSNTKGNYLGPYTMLTMTTTTTTTTTAAAATATGDAVTTAAAGPTAASVSVTSLTSVKNGVRRSAVGGVVGLVVFFAAFVLC